MNISLYHRLRAVKLNLRNWAGKRTGLFAFYGFFFERQRRRLFIGPDTDIVIEGFGGSGNSLAVHGFKRAQPEGCKIAHHIHVPAQVIEGIRLRKPVLLLIREPSDAAISLLSRGHYPTARGALRDYSRFYETLLPFRGEVVLANFTEVTTDLGGVIQLVNRKFGTGFKPIKQTEALAALREHQKGIPSKRAALPSLERVPYKDAARKQLENPRLAHLLRQAHAIYERFIEQPKSPTDTPNPPICA